MGTFQMFYFEFRDDLHFTWSWLLSELPGLLMGGRLQLMTVDVSAMCNQGYGCIVATTVRAWSSIHGGLPGVYLKSSIRIHTLSPFGKPPCTPHVCVCILQSEIPILFRFHQPLKLKPTMRLSHPHTYMK